MNCEFLFPESFREQALILDSPLFRNWVQKASKTLEIKSILFQSADFVQRKGEKHLLFLKFHADVYDKEGNKVNGITFLRGGAVGVLVILTFEGKKYIVVVEQPRIGLANLTYPEIPAGMLDGEGNAKKIAVQELWEEAQIKCAEDDLIPLIDNATGQIESSVGVSDEFLKLYLLEKGIDQAEFDKLQDLYIENPKENERITVKLLPFENAHHTFSDVKSICALYYYQKLKS